MAFGMFKKRETLDLTKKGIDSDVPTEGYFKRKGINTSTSTNRSTTSTASSTSQTPSQTSSTGGFFGFFGADNSSASSSATTPQSSAQTSTYPDYSSFSNSTNTASLDAERIKSQLDDLLYKFSRLADRVELLEKKMDRLERKNPE